MIEKFENFNSDDFYKSISSSSDFDNTTNVGMSEFKKIREMFYGWDCELDRFGRVALRDRQKCSPIGKETGFITVAFISVIEDDYYGVTYWTGDDEIKKSICDQFEGLVKYLTDEKLIYRK